MSRCSVNDPIVGIGECATETTHTTQVYESELEMSHRYSAMITVGIVAAIFTIGSAVILGSMLPGYDSVSQTISELGEANSPFEEIFRVITLVDAVLLIVFSLGVRAHSIKNGLSTFPSLLIGFYGLMELGLGLFQAPHPLHNLFGISSTPGFFAPLALALVWKGSDNLQKLRRLSAGFFVVILLAMISNLSPLIHSYDFIIEHYGIFQRLLLFSFYAWVGILAVFLLRHGDEERATI